MASNTGLMNTQSSTNSDSLYIGDLQWWTTDEDLRQHPPPLLSAHRFSSVLY
ncbi:hypothetical protein DFH05DRAFT_1528900 [Lentinula detonsa]|uniref:Uncharacterized protein n=1 Tax=Lentinula detonsa TaxID=2804962 RepID=A0A9W8TU61_9AGAR|nr:hypothetical protein DFH05DRAFT_1528900 [Lentinula detonsa]